MQFYGGNLDLSCLKAHLELLGTHFVDNPGCFTLLDNQKHLKFLSPAF